MLWTPDVPHQTAGAQFPGEEQPVDSSMLYSTSNDGILDRNATPALQPQ
ncbi:hypothetical protein [Allorhodopirellula heiligendammensis]|nr:hypothetical protein [Allorhodopirellula heiligendammensis]